MINSVIPALCAKSFSSSAEIILSLRGDFLTTSASELLGKIVFMFWFGQTHPVTIFVSRGSFELN